MNGSRWVKAGRDSGYDEHYVYGGSSRVIASVGRNSSGEVWTCRAPSCPSEITFFCVPASSRKSAKQAAELHIHDVHRL